jgi:ligand-binding sensor domain-containing protein
MKKHFFLISLLLLVSGVKICYGQWKEIGPYGGNVTWFANDGQNIWAGTEDYDLYLSTNQGGSWSLVNYSISNSPIYSIAISGKYIYAAVAEGIIISSDNGKSWQVDSLVNHWYNISAKDSNVYLTGGMYNNGMWISSNYGKSWKFTNVLPYKGITSNIATYGRNVYVGTSEEGIYLSTDNGLTWNNIGQKLNYTVVVSIAVDSTGIYAATVGGVFLSTNSGKSWSAINTGIKDTNYCINTIVKNGGNLYLGTDDGVYLSTNKGNSWNKVNTGLKDSVVATINIMGSNLYAGTDRGIYLSTNNGDNWSLSNTGLTGLEMGPLATNNANIYAGTGDGKIFVSTNNGDDWTNPFGEINVNGPTFSESTGIKTIAVKGSEIFAGTETFIGWPFPLVFGGIILSTDNGVNWAPADSGLAGSPILSIVINGENLLAETWGGGIYLSTNNGMVWENRGLDSSQSANSIAIEGENLYAGTSGGRLYKSTDNGLNWRVMNTGLTNNAINSIVAFGTNVFAGTNNGIFYSSNNGTSWKEANTGLTTDTTVNTLVTDGKNVFAGTKGGIYLTTNNGESWTAIDDGFPQGGAYSLAINNEYLYAGSLSTGWRRALTDFNSYNIEGIVKYDNKQSTGTANTMVYLETPEGAKLDSTTTDITGAYSFNIPNGTYKLVCGKTGMKWGGCNPVDALTENRYFVGLIKTFGGNNELRKIAADVNNDGNINPQDALMILKRFLNIIKHFSISDWIFDTPTVTVNNASVNQDITAICAGDVNGSYPK